MRHYHAKFSGDLIIVANGDLTDFKNGGCLPSWICCTHVWTTEQSIWLSLLLWKIWLDLMNWYGSFNIIRVSLKNA